MVVVVRMVVMVLWDGDGVGGVGGDGDWVWKDGRMGGWEGW